MRLSHSHAHLYNKFKIIRVELRNSIDRTRYNKIYIISYYKIDLIMLLNNEIKILIEVI